MEGVYEVYAGYSVRFSHEWEPVVYKMKEWCHKRDMEYRYGVNIDASKDRVTFMPNFTFRDQGDAIEFKMRWK